MLGGLRPTSDLDILAIVDRPTTADERRHIVDRLLEVSGTRASGGPARRVELNVVRQSELRPWRPVPVVDLLYGEWLRKDFEGGVIPEPLAMPDFAPAVVLALHGDAALFGPRPATLIDPVSPGGLRSSILAGVPSLIEDLPGDTRNVLLTFARIWATLETGEIQPKDVSAAWAADRLPEDHRAAMNRARAMYLEGWDEDDWGDRAPAARALADQLLAAIRGAAPDEEIP